MKNINIVLVGVGGQGLIKASDTLAYAAFYENMDVKKAEVHGLAQRGGSLFIQIKIGKKVYSPLIDKQSADILVGFEKLESYRYFHYLKENGTLIYDDLEIVPVGFSKSEYPPNIDAFFKEQKCNVIKCKAMELAIKLGNPRQQNMIMLKELNNILKFSKESWKKAINKVFKPEIAAQIIPLFEHNF